MKCPKCGNSKIVDSANGKKCVNCNFEWKPKKTGCFTWLVTIFVVIFVLPIFIGSLLPRDEYTPNTSNSTASSKPQQQAISTPKSLWFRKTEKDEFNGSNNLYFANRSSDYFIGHFDTKHYPAIIVRCKDNKTQVVINFDTTMTCFGDMKIGLKIDDQEPYYENWNAATNCEALFSPHPIKLLKNLKDHQKLMVKFTPFQKGDINANFDLLGIEDVVTETSQACKWSK